MPTPSSYDSDGRFVFRLATPEEKANLGKTNVPQFLAKTVVEGEPHLALIVHVIVGILGGLYGALSMLSIWPHEFAFLGQCILTGMKGAALGSALVGAYLRWSPQGRTVKRRMKENTATKLDEKLRLLGQLSFAFGVYFFIGVTFFEYFPHLSEQAPMSMPLRLGRHFAQKAKVEKLWYAFERWGTAPAAGAQLLRPTFLIKP
ncbi:hypothetical protein OC834_006673 [Tilletia horrida]|uniref:Uncharacterized protein n=1 Tax=Tilletia horrida TaxID=155126 RepID=A0AAN6JMT5_9BASI|nr:hypothetical protein OC834_006673 [Tilletia horrida]KAK0540549.1 hypothetical protein OC842_000404 [Tilletia horrida]KAK0541190.1 hypothetical protein OC835_000282 [Tilletia horrida]KAK0561446.1 hypothetical protein OC844_003210 [Tilletia horrida]